MAAAKTFMANAVEIEVDTLAPPDNATKVDLTPEDEQFWTTALAIGQSLLLSGGVPAFDPSTILSHNVDEGTDTQTLEVTVPTVENMHAQLTLQNYDQAFQLAAQFATPEAKRPSVQDIIDGLEDTLIKPTRARGDGREIDIFCLREAYNNGVQFDYLGNSVYRFGQGAQSRMISRSATDKDPFISARIANDKAKTLRFLKSAGIPTPRSILVSTLEQATDAARTIGMPVVIKPADRDRSEGVSLDISTDDEIPAGFEAAQKWSNRILVEEQVPGDCHRLVTFQKTFVYSFARRPKAVVGDGEKSVKDLIAAANETRDKRAKHKQNRPFPLDAEALERLKDQGMTPDSVPAKDQLAFLRTHNTKDGGGYNEETTEKMHPANIALAERISRLLRFESMGLDLMATDITKPWFETGARVTEVNYTPQIGANTAREYIAREFGQTQGRIPIHVFIGDEDALAEAVVFRDTLADNGTKAFLTSHDQTLGPDGQDVPLQIQARLFERSQALLADPMCDALVLVVNTDEFTLRGLPILQVSTVRVVNKTLTSFRNRQQSITESEVDHLIETITERAANET